MGFILKYASILIFFSVSYLMNFRNGVGINVISSEESLLIVFMPQYRMFPTIPFDF